MQWGPAGHSQGGSDVKGGSWNTLGGPLDKLEKIFRHHSVQGGDLFCAEAKSAFFLLLFFRTRRLAPSAEAVHSFWNVYFDKIILFDPARHACPLHICALTLLFRNIDISGGCVWHWWCSRSCHLLTRSLCPTISTVPLRSASLLVRGTR